MTRKPQTQPVATPHSSCPRRLRCLGYCGLLGLIVFASASPAADSGNPMDEPLRLLAQARENFAKVRDYSCTMIKRERLNGQLSPDNIILMKVRNQPFSVYLRWVEPKAMVGQEVCYVAGKNEGKMRVKSPGLLGAVGFVSLDPNDERARKSSRHTITEAGIGNLLDRYQTGWEAERKLNQTQVRIGEYEYNKRRCTRVETSLKVNPEGKLPYQRTVVYFDKELGLPIRVECYDWPRLAGEAGELVEVYSYVNLKLNVGLPEDVFHH